jgi:uncharacterized protein YxjI
MKLLIKQRVFAWGDKYDVYDEWEQPRYFVRTELLALGHQIHVTDRISGQEVGQIRQKLLTLMPQFVLEADGVDRGSLHRELTFLRPRYRLDSMGWTVQGNFIGLDYDVLDRNGQPVMHLSKELFHWGDTYVLDIYAPEQALLCLLVTIAIDAANCNN